MFIMTGLYNKLIIANHHLANLRFTKGWSNFNSLTSLLGFVWKELILLKLKIENWKHCSKIIFKYVNSIVESIFNEKIVKKWDLWVP